MSYRTDRLESSSAFATPSTRPGGLAADLLAVLGIVAVLHQNGVSNVHSRRQTQTFVEAGVERRHGIEGQRHVLRRIRLAEVPIQETLGSTDNQNRPYPRLLHLSTPATHPD